MDSSDRQRQLPRVTVVVLNFNGLQHLEPCFKSLRQLDYPRERLELMLMDNGSFDGSAGYVRSAFPDVTVVAHPSNVGFAAGNNIAARAAKGDYVVFLNNDMRVRPGFVRGLVETLETDEQAVAAGALILSWDGKRIDFAGSYCNYAGHAAQRGAGEPYRPGAYTAVEPILFPCGGAMIVDRELFLDVGGFDETYFIYFEDVDLGWRLWLYGHKVLFAPSAVAQHHHHGTMGAHSNAKIELLYRRNSLRTIIKNYDDENLGRALSAALLATASSVTERSVAAGRIDPSAFSLSTLDGPQDSTVDRMSIASLLALGEVAETLPEVFARRREVQARRTRADSDIAQLFRPQYPQVPWYSTATGYQIFESFGLAELFESAPRRILVVSPDVLPYPGLATVGSGLRAWGLGQGLISRGHDVVFSMPRAAAEKHRALITDEIFANSWPFFGISDIVQRVAPDVVLVVGWALAAHLVVEREAPDRVPIVIDQHGPHILERRFQQLGDSRQNADEKIEALKKADYFTCAGGKQATYFADWLGSAAWDDEEIAERSAALPFSLSPELPTHEPRDELTFVFGGVFLPWQDPTAGLHQLAAEMARRRRGRLMIFGGRHQLYDIEEGPIADALRSLRDHPYVAVSPAIPHDELIEEYRRAHVAIDLMRRNPERELAFTSRTVEYLWCGLPVIYNDYAELADYIRRYEAGWTVDPDDPEALAEVLTQIFESPELVAERGRNAQELVRAELTWDKTIGPLDAFVRRATLRRPHPVAVPGGTPSASEATFASGPPVPEVVTRTVVRLHRTLPPGVRHAMRRGLGALVGEHTPRNRNGLPVEVIAAVERLRRLTSRAAQ